MNAIKRPIDLFLSVSALIGLLPVMLIVAFLVRLKLGSPVFYKAERVGFKGRVFTLYKFRSMTDEVDSNGEPLPDDVRLTPFGTFLRKSSLDELLGLFNVVKGDAAIVGPRPLSSLYRDMYTPHQNRRHDVRPGMTGWSQVNGRNSLSWEEKFEMDIWYVENQSFSLDAKIIMKTIKIVFAMKDVSQSGHVTAAPWTSTKPANTQFEEPTEMSSETNKEYTS